MLERTKARALPLVNQAADGAPVVTACCNACRACVTTNVVAATLTLLGSAAAATVALTRRLFAAPS